MSRGLGRIERGILAALEAEPDNAFTVEDLCDRIYPGVNRLEKKHRVAVIRAMKNLVRCREHLHWWPSEMSGGTLIIFDHSNIRAYGMARLKGSRHQRYRDPLGHGPKSEDDLRKTLQDDRHQKLMAEGGAWWRHCQIAMAERSGDAALASRLNAENEAAIAAVFSRP